MGKTETTKPTLIIGEPRDRMMSQIGKNRTTASLYCKCFWSRFWCKMNHERIADVNIYEKAVDGYIVQIHYYQGEPFAQTMIIPIESKTGILNLFKKKVITTVIVQGISKSGVVYNA